MTAFLLKSPGFGNQPYNSLHVKLRELASQPSCLHHWVWYVQWWMLTLTGHAPSDPIYQIDLAMAAAICTMLALVLAIGLKGTPRWQAIAVAAVFFIARKPFGYV
jgi:hypothetical protein